MTPYTEAELLADSTSYLAELRESKRAGAANPRVCHHFFPLDGAPTDAYLPRLPEMISDIDPSGLLEVIGDPVGIEVWYLQEPDDKWLTPLIKSFHAAAVSCCAVYGGWSYEPRRH